MLRRGKTSPYKAITESGARALLVQVNADIEEAAQSAACSLLDGSYQRKISYPPNHGFTAEELTALDVLKAIPNLELALRKIIADAASFPVFRVFEYIDGTADPDDDAWEGACLVDRPDKDSDVLVDDTAYHDQLYTHYWDWRKIRPTKEWKLDTLEDDLS